MLISLERTSSKASSAKSWMSVSESILAITDSSTTIWIVYSLEDFIPFIYYFNQVNIFTYSVWKISNRLIVTRQFVKSLDKSLDITGSVKMYYFVGQGLEKSKVSLPTNHKTFKYTFLFQLHNCSLQSMKTTKLIPNW